MDENYDKRKMLEILMDPDVSIILSELEDGNKESSYLEDKLQISDMEIRKRLSYLIQHGFVKIVEERNQVTYIVEKDKLDKIMEIDEAFSGVVEGLTELDQYLN